MATKKNFIKSMLADCKSGEVSSKRVIGFIGFLCLLIVMFINALYPKSIAPSDMLVDAIKYIVIGALFSTSVEKFAKEPKDKEPEI
tara:strand:+ start:1624 stop:1881 length:258 start_codon:yes stop_codon:yes gene_type:complete